MTQVVFPLLIEEVVKYKTVCVGADECPDAGGVFFFFFITLEPRVERYHHL